jgi:hypothetical protein
MGFNFDGPPSEKKKPEPLRDPELIKLRNKLLAVVEIIPKFYTLSPKMVEGFVKGLDAALAENKDKVSQVYKECEAVMFAPLENHGIGNIIKMLDITNDRLKIKEPFRWAIERGVVKVYLDGEEAPVKVPAMIEEIRKIFRR